MKQFRVTAEFEDGTEHQNKFDYWHDATEWIDKLAEGDVMLTDVKMWIIRK